MQVCIIITSHRVKVVRTNTVGELVLIYLAVQKVTVFGWLVEHLHNKVAQSAENRAKYFTWH